MLELPHGAISLWPPVWSSESETPLYSSTHVLPLSASAYSFLWCVNYMRWRQIQLFQRNHAFGSNRFAHPGLNHLHTHSQGAQWNSSLPEVNHRAKGAVSSEVIIIPPLCSFSPSTLRRPWVQPWSYPIRGDTLPSTGWKYDRSKKLLRAALIFLSHIGAGFKIINMMIEKHK